MFNDISIIIPVYHAKNTLKKTLKSILVQKLNNDKLKIEIILSVDDQKDYSEFIKSNFSVDMKVNDTFDLVCSCIEQVYSEEESWAAADCTKKEMNEFLEQLNTTQFQKIEKFFETMPKLSHTIKVLNPKTKVESDVVLEGLTAFFG